MDAQWRVGRLARPDDLYAIIVGLVSLLRQVAFRAAAVGFGEKMRLDKSRD